MLGWPDNGKILIRSLRQGSEHHPREIAKVDMLGRGAPITWTRTSEGFEISTTGTAPSRYAVAFRIHAA